MSASIEQQGSPGVMLRVGDTDAEVTFVQPGDLERVRRALEANASAAVQVRPAKDADTSGHSLRASEIFVEIDLGDDTEGHAIALRFPTAQDARDFQLKVLAAGAIAGTLVVASLGQVAAPSIGDTTSAPSAAQGYADQRAGEFRTGTVPGTGYTDQRAGEIGLGSVPAPGTGGGLAEHRAGEIGLGSVPAQASAAEGFADQRRGEINAGAPDATTQSAQEWESRAKQTGGGYVVQDPVMQSAQDWETRAKQTGGGYATQAGGTGVTRDHFEAGGGYAAQDSTIGAGDDWEKVQAQTGGGYLDSTIGAGDDWEKMQAQTGGGYLDSTIGAGDDWEKASPTGASGSDAYESEADARSQAAKGDSDEPPPGPFRGR